MLALYESFSGQGMKMNEVNKMLDDLMSKCHMNLQVPENHRKDSISHWVLRLAFCGNEDLIHRFLHFEW